MPFHLGCSEVAEHCQVGAFPEEFRNNLGEFYTAPDGYEVHIFGRTSEEEIAYTSPYGIAGATDGIGRLAYSVIEGCVYFCNYFI